MGCSVFYVRKDIRNSPGNDIVSVTSICIIFNTDLSCNVPAQIPEKSESHIIDWIFILHFKTWCLKTLLSCLSDI